MYCSTEAFSNFLIGIIDSYNYKLIHPKSLNNLNNRKTYCKALRFILTIL